MFLPSKQQTNIYHILIWRKKFWNEGHIIKTTYLDYNKSNFYSQGYLAVFKNLLKHMVLPGGCETIREKTGHPKFIIKGELKGDFLHINDLISLADTF